MMNTKRKDLLLIKPIKSSHAIQTVPPLGLGFISSYLKKHNFKVDILDCNINQISPDKLVNFVDLTQYMAIGFQVFTIDTVIVKRYLEQIRMVIPEAILIVGGVQPSCDPIMTMRYLDQANLGVNGEGETTMKLVLEALREGNGITKGRWDVIPNLILREGEDIYVTKRYYEKNLDDIGAPDWTALNPDLYSGTAHGFYFRREPVMPIIVTRGCPYRCTFCGGRNITGYRVRARSPQSVIEELMFLKRNYNLREFQIIDDNFTSIKSLVVEFCQKLITESMDLIWTCPNGIRLDTLDRDVVELMKKAGCYEVSVGIESGSQKILDDMRKRLTLDLIKEKINLLDSAGISVIGFVMVGYPTDTAETINESMRFVLELHLNRISLTRFVPLPGTPITEKLIESGQYSRDNISFDSMTYDKFIFTPQGISDKALRKLYRKFFFRFYMRPLIILHNILSVRSYKHFKNLMIKAITFLR
jgi:radical SAM superfamily enzyme YgiQ (UPF0313 family)